VLLVVQNAHLALEIADRAYVLETGRIVLYGKAQDLLESDESDPVFVVEVESDGTATLRFGDDALRAQGRVGLGVAAINLAANAVVVSACYLDGEQKNTASDPLSLFVVTQSGLGKKVPLSQYPQKGRVTAGVITTELADKDKVLSATVINERAPFLLISNGAGNEPVSAVQAAEL